MGSSSPNLRGCESGCGHWGGFCGVMRGSWWSWVDVVSLGFWWSSLSGVHRVSTLRGWTSEPRSVLWLRPDGQEAPGPGGGTASHVLSSPSVGWAPRAAGHSGAPISYRSPGGLPKSRLPWDQILVGIWGACVPSHPLISSWDDPEPKASCLRVGARAPGPPRPGVPVTTQG